MPVSKHRLKVVALEQDLLARESHHKKELSSKQSHRLASQARQIQQLDTKEMLFVISNLFAREKLYSAKTLRLTMII